MATVMQRIRLDWRHLCVLGSVELCIAYASWVVISMYPVLYRLDDAGTAFFLCIMGGTGLWHIRRGIQRWSGIRALGDTPRLMRTLNWIVSLKARRNQTDGVYLGEGFSWGPEHCQAFHEVSSLPEKAKYFQQDSGSDGQSFIHNINNIISPHADQPQIFTLPEHTAIIGTTGIGKTRLFELIIAQIIKRGETVVVIDPKPDQDFLDTVYQTSLDAGREDRFRLFSLAHPQLSVTINPLANFSTPSEIASRIATIMPNTGNSKPFVDFCYDVLATVAGVLILIEVPSTLKSLFQYAVLDRESLKTLALQYQAKKGLSPDHRKQLMEAMTELEAKINHDKAHFQKMTTSLLPVLKSLTSGNIGALLNPEGQSLTWGNIIDRNLVVYISLAAMKDSYVATNTGKLIIQDLVSFIGCAYTERTTHPPIHLFVDETYSVVYEGFVDILNKSRAAGLRLYLGLQTTADIEARISDAVRRQMYGLISNKIYMRTPDSTQAEELIATLGTCEIPKRTFTRTLAAKPGSMEDYFRSSTAERCDMTSTELLPADVLTSLPRGHAVVVTQGRPPVKIRVPLLDRTGLPKESFFGHIAATYQPLHLDTIREQLAVDWKSVADEALSPEKYEAM